MERAIDTRPAGGGSVATSDWVPAVDIQGGFYRRSGLPDSADPDKITANSNLGVLEVRIGKQEKVQPRKILVNR
jgi:HSP20 family molecular chaperone IbpA